MTTRPRTLLAAIYRLYEHSGFTMAGAVAFSFVLSLFPFCIFLGAVAGLFGSPQLADEAVRQMFDILPEAVAQALAPQVTLIMGSSRIDLLTVSAGIALFFATSAIETLRAAFNGAYRVQETRPYLMCLLLSMAVVLVSAVLMVATTWLLVVGPAIAQKLEPAWLQRLETTWLAFLKTILPSANVSLFTRYVGAGAIVGCVLLMLHLWLAAGRRTIVEVLPGIVLSILLWLTAAGLYAYYLDFSDYTRFYAGLSQLMVALIFFQVTAVIVILGAELNRGLIELKRMSAEGLV